MFWQLRSHFSSPDSYSCCSLSPSISHCPFLFLISFNFFPVASCNCLLHFLPMVIFSLFSFSGPVLFLVLPLYFLDLNFIFPSQTPKQCVFQSNNTVTSLLFIFANVCQKAGICHTIQICPYLHSKLLWLISSSHSSVIKTKELAIDLNDIM